MAEWNLKRQYAKIDTLTLELIKELAKKGDALGWSDFEQYNSKELGSGLYILHYDIDENYYLLIGGGNMQTLPLYIYLVSKADDSVGVWMAQIKLQPIKKKREKGIDYEIFIFRGCS